MSKEIAFSKRVYEKEFTIEPVGYKCIEVDSFFDDINAEIEKLERKITELKEDIDRLESDKKNLKNTISKLNEENASLKATKGSIVNSNTGYNTNIEMIERMSALETKVESILEMLKK